MERPESSSPLPAVACAVCLLLALGFSASCSSKYKASENDPAPQRIVDRALATLKDFQQRQDMQDLMDLVAEADGLVVFPDATKGAFLYGAQLGLGVTLGRNATGAWSAPSFCTISEMSAGLQAGFQTGPLMLVLLSDKALVLAVDVGFSLGGDASVTVGPVTASHITSSTTARKDVVYYWNPLGAYAGMSLKGGLLSPQPELNAAYYGDQDATAHRIVIKGKYANPGARDLVEFLDRLSSPAAAFN
jgi:lipid-binding SYLF domain-containing protein